MSAEVFPSSRVHPVEDLLEEYAFRRVAEPLLSHLEEHLLICVPCQERLREIDDYVAAMKQGVAEMELRDRLLHVPVELPAGNALSNEGWLSKWLPIRPLPAFAWIAAGVILIAVLSGIVRMQSSSPGVPAVVLLSAMRGADGTATAPSGRPLNLRIDATRLPEDRGAMSLEIVNGAGKQVWFGPAMDEPAGSNRRLILGATVHTGLRRGQYWARLYTADKTLLREFGLRID
jgi:hypothetical protein